MIEESLDIILPCYNPHKNWTLEVINSYNEIKSNAKDTEVNVIIINDGSNNNHFNEQIISELKTRIPNIQIINYSVNQGKGYALREGVRLSKSDYIILTDIDFPYESESLNKIYIELKKGADVVLGNRDENYYKKVPIVRTLISKTLKGFIKFFLKLPTTDTQCGLKGFNKKTKYLFTSTKINRFLFDLEFVKYCSVEKGLKIKLQSVNLKEGVVFSKMNYKILLSEGINFLKIYFK